VKLFKHLLLITLLIISNLSHAKTFKVGDTILVSFPANDIKSDAYLIGIVRKITTKGNYQISVRDFVEGHDYGLSCTPIAINKAGQESTKSGWQVWQDSRNPMSSQLEFIVPANKAMKLSTGKLMFIDRYNVYITYSRWKSNVPIMSISKIEAVKIAAKDAGIEAINPALDLAILDRKSYYDPQIGRPYWAYETIKPLIILLTEIQNILNKDKQLNKLWRAKTRDWQAIEKDMKTFFLIDAIDKSVTDASYQLNEAGLEKANPKDLAKLKQQLKDLK